MHTKVESYTAKPFSFGAGVAAAFVAVIVLSHPTPSVAETAEERAACRPDVWRLCAGEIPNRNRIVACLIRKRSQLSPACAVVFTPPGEQRR